MAGLAPSHLRVPAPPDGPTFEPRDMPVPDAPPEGGDQEVYDDKGALLRIEHDDGSVTISLNGDYACKISGIRG